MRSTVDFLLYGWLKVETLIQQPRFAEHSREVYDSVLDTCQRIAREKVAPYYRQADIEEPWFDGEKVRLPEVTCAAAKAYAESGMLAATQDYAMGGMQLPCVVETAANGFFALAGPGMDGAAMLTSGNASLLIRHGTEAQKTAFARNEFSGRFSGTMCLSEPQAGSSLSDILTRAVPDGLDFESDPLGPRYRLTGNKMWISAGDHELTENIVHLVLAKIPGSDGRLIPGTKGLSLFIVPKKLVAADGSLTGERNDVALAGLNHKCGFRAIPNALLNFGEGKFPLRAPGGVDGRGAGAIGYRVGEASRGLSYMFHMMNGARIGVGLAATMSGYAGYLAALDYARNRCQGRPVGADGKDQATAPIPIIQHADVKRMLLAQKTYCEGALALALYCARLVDELHTSDVEGAREAAALLEVLTPIAKSWPSEWCLEANSLAIQVHGGYGYTRDFPVEMYWRDNRLNMIHEGTHGVQALDLLGRKVVMDGGYALTLLVARMNETVGQARQVPLLADYADELAAMIARLLDATREAWATGVATEALANATLYLQAFGHTILGWIWLDVALFTQDALVQGGDEAMCRGKLAACRFFFHYEMPRIPAWLGVVKSRDDTCRTMEEDWF